MIILPKLSFSFDALEPYIDTKTMEIHYTKHHQSYIDKLNSVLDKYDDIEKIPVEDLLRNISSLGVDDNDRRIIRNHGGGHINHTFFWSILGKNKNPDNILVQKITKKFGSIDKFKEIFSQTAINHFGSGWVWLAEDKTKNLDIYSTPNQDSPYLSNHTPLIGLDVWEHAYYLKYQNRRAEYVKNWWNVLKIIE